MSVKLGLSYGAFDGLELLEYVLKEIRSEVDFICLVRQYTSYHGNSADPVDLETIDWLKKVGLADEIVDCTYDLSLPPRTNETLMRNIGLDRSIANGCTHHGSVDVDEFYLKDQLRYAKSAIADYEWSLAESLDYYKHPTYKIIPERRHLISLIHPVHVRYAMNREFPYRVDLTRRPDRCEKCLVFQPNEIEIHHMNYVRNNIRKKCGNNLNHIKRSQKKFYETFDKYKLGERLCIPPDLLNRRTTQVPNLFNIKENNGRIISDRS